MYILKSFLQDLLLMYYILIGIKWHNREVFLLETLREVEHNRFYMEGDKQMLRFEVPAKSKT